MRFVIVNTVDWEACQGLAAGKMQEEEAVRRIAGCTWLIRASAAVDDVEQALREAILDFFSSDEGEKVLRGEELQPLTWEAAIPWIPDDTWSRFGLEVVRHPDVERLVLDGNEDLAQGLSRRSA